MVRLLVFFPPPLATAANLDTVKTFDDYNNYMPSKAIKPGHVYDRMIPRDQVRQSLDNVKGHLVWMPLQFLKDAPMAEKGLQINALTESVYT
jgi:phospholipase D1/2